MVAAIEAAVLMAAVVMAATVVAATGVVVGNIVVPPAVTWQFEQPGNPRPLVSDPSLYSSRAPSKPHKVSQQYHNPPSGDDDHQPAADAERDQGRRGTE
jgi:hypothetical protein